MTLNDRLNRLYRDEKLNPTGMVALRAAARFAAAVENQMDSYAAESRDDYTLAGTAGDDAREANDELSGLLMLPTGRTMAHVKAAAYAFANGEDVR